MGYEGLQGVSRDYKVIQIRQDKITKLIPNSLGIRRIPA